MSAHVHPAVKDIDQTMRDESVLDPGEESDVMDNVVFNRPSEPV
jgi:hypothetical protein